MKKSIFLLSLLCSIFASPHLSSAVEIKAKGYFDFGFGLYDGTNFTKHDAEESFDSGQQFRTQLDFIASDSLKGVATFEIGSIYWGSGGGATWNSSGATGVGSGGAMGADGVNVEVKNLYIDWSVPQTELQVRMGIQLVALPNAVWRGDYLNGGVVSDDDAPGIIISNTFNENLGFSLGWYRPWDPYTNDDFKRGSSLSKKFGNDEIDAFFLTLPIDVQDSFNLTPYVMYASIGRVDTEEDANGMLTRNGLISYTLSSNGALGDSGDAWWTGLSFTLNHFDPFNAYLDLIYGSYTADNTTPTAMTSNSNPSRDGWVAIGKLEYKLDKLTPNIFGWYGSGSNSIEEDGFDGMMPGLSPFFGLTSFGFGTDRNDITRQALLGLDPYGKWGIGVGLDDINVIENLSSHFRVLYMRGTNDTDNMDRAFWDYGAFDSKDQAIEVNLDSVYKIYENLELDVELGYINLQLENEPEGFEENAWKAYTGFRYTF